MKHDETVERRPLRGPWGRSLTGTDEYRPGMLEAVESLIGDVRELHTTVRGQGGIRNLGAQSSTIVNGASQRLSASAGQLAGYGLRETAGAPAVVRLLNGVDTGGDLLVPISLAAGESVRDWFLPHGISFGAGLYVQVLSGTIEGAIYFGPRR